MNSNWYGFTKKFRERHLDNQNKTEKGMDEGEMGRTGGRDVYKE